MNTEHSRHWNWPRQLGNVCIKLAHFRERSSNKSLSDVADLYPTATVRGVDMFPPPVTWMPPNCVFEVDDILREWTWREPFDFIHLRLMYGAFDPAGWEKVYKQAYE